MVELFNSSFSRPEPTAKTRPALYPSKPDSILEPRKPEGADSIALKRATCQSARNPIDSNSPGGENATERERMRGFGDTGVASVMNSIHISYGGAEPSHTGGAAGTGVRED